MLIKLKLVTFQGIFTVPMSGTLRVSFSLRSNSRFGQINEAYIRLNGHFVPESRHYTYSDLGEVDSTGGREVILEVSAGDIISLWSGYSLNGYFERIMTCFEYKPTM